MCAVSEPLMVILIVCDIMSVTLLYHTEIQERGEQQQRGFRSRQVDTNILAVRFDTLSGRGNIHTGDVVVCDNQECTAVLSHLSKITGEPDADRKVYMTFLATSSGRLHDRTL